MEEDQVRAILGLIRNILKKRKISLGDLSKQLDVSSNKISEQLFFRKKLDEELLMYLLAYLDVQWDFNNDLDLLPKILGHYGYEYFKDTKKIRRIQNREGARRRNYNTGFDILDSNQVFSKNFGDNIKKFDNQMDILMKNL